MEKDIIIVGGGIAGLSAGYYSVLNGYSTSIFEMHKIPGGLCTAWKRKGYTFDVSMHMLMGSSSGPLHRMWKELGIIDNFTFHYHEVISSVEGLEDNLTFTTSKEQMEAQLLAISPEDRELIMEFTRLAFGPDMMNAASLDPAELRTIGDSLRMLRAVLPMVRVFRKYGRMTLQEFAEKFRHPFLKKAIRYFIDSPGWPMKEFPMIPLAGAVKSMVSEAGVPLGGSQQVMFRLADRYRELGGEINFNSRVCDLIIEDNRVKGIRLGDGTEHRAKQVIWAGDGHTLIYDILGERYINDSIRNMYENWIPVESMVQVMIGVDMDFSEVPHQVTFETEEPVTIAGREHRWLFMLHHTFDKSMAPEGKSAVEVWYATDYDYWEELHKDRAAYKAEKQRIAEYSISQLDRRWPGFAKKVETVDVPTPVTYRRYTGNWKGSPDGWYITPANMRTQESLRKLPGLDDLWMVGQWTAPFTGTVMAALSGRQTLQLLCRQDRKKFVSMKATEPR